MKKKDVEKRLRKLGWRLERHGANHDIWTDGEAMVAVPRHREINEITARSLIKKAEGRKKKK